MKRIIKSNKYLMKQSQSLQEENDYYGLIPEDSPSLSDTHMERWEYENNNSTKNTDQYPNAEKVKEYYNSVINTATDVINILEEYKKRPRSIPQHAEQLEHALINFINSEHS